MDAKELPIKYWKPSDLEKARRKTRQELYLRDSPQTAYCWECIYNQVCKTPKPCHVLRFQPYIVYHILQALTALGIVVQKVSLKTPSAKIRVEIKDCPKLILNPSFFRNGRECKQNLGIVLARNPDYKHFTTISAGERLLKNAGEYYRNCAVQEILKSGNIRQESIPQSIPNEQNGGELSCSRGNENENENENRKKIAREKLLETFFADFSEDFKGGTN